MELVTAPSFTANYGYYWDNLLFVPAQAVNGTNSQARYLDQYGVLFGVAGDPAVHNLWGNPAPEYTDNYQMATRQQGAGSFS